jgi:hypothetical protein
VIELVIDFFTDVDRRGADDGALSGVTFEADSEAARN